MASITASSESSEPSTLHEDRSSRRKKQKVNTVDETEEQKTPTPSNSNHPMMENKEAGRSVFVAGFAEHQPYNLSLWQIVQELLPYYYVSCNPTTTQSWTSNDTAVQFRGSVRGMIYSADVVLFSMNEYTLADRRCLFILQTAWDLMVPILMIRNPRMKLIFKSGDKLQSEFNNQDPTMGILMDIIREGYHRSLPYNRFHHGVGIRKIKHNLKMILENIRNVDMNGRGSNTNLSSNEMSRCSTADLKLPSIVHRSCSSRIGPETPESKTPDGPPGMSILSAPTIISRSRSMNDIFPPRTGKNSNQKEIPRRKRNKWNSSTKLQDVEGCSGRIQKGSPLKAPRSVSTADNGLNLSNDNLAKKDEKESRNSSHNNDWVPPTRSVTSQDDESLYHSTQYIIFPVKNTGTKPTVVNFPEDLRDDQLLKLETIWGSDESLDREFEIANKMIGDVNICSPPSSPAPYIGALV